MERIGSSWWQDCSRSLPWQRTAKHTAARSHADDYVFLDHTLQAQFTDLWSHEKLGLRLVPTLVPRGSLWCDQSIAGPSEAAFRLVGVLLWILGSVHHAAC